MTEHRDLKRRVRERMARTGESYSTARRDVVAHAPTPGHHRESLLVGRLLGHAGVSISEAMVCGLAGGVGFMYAVFEYRGLPPMVTIVAQHHPGPWAPAALRLARVHECLERELTAPGATRPLYAAFLDEAGLPPDAGVAYRAAGARWTRLAEAALAASTSGENPATALRRLADLAHDAHAAERRAIAVIEYR